MKLPTELDDEYINTVLSNLSLKDIPDEQWKLIEGFDNYAIPSCSRVKSRKRLVTLPNGGEQKILAKIIKPQVFRYYNRHLKAHFYNVRCNLSIEGKESGVNYPLAGNPLSNKLKCVPQTHEDLDWKEISMKTLEGRKSAFGERNKIYGN
ncbi:NUMOD4 domain-containing protein [Chryseobacterium potabilaquae]|uniref:NUMOD4 domain-containing protein n=1 Tax=Chryseobacterium potabilaquae TaxID=2675057 RepID=A0A6N4X986_9FLAO|nr:NUMOD4 domain-containing protein [Chryseobacterium potabilaquae]CAA7197626.1 hypothetical protein CHRY9293_03699 [Chryseobacterium potabilaquae]